MTKKICYIEEDTTIEITGSGIAKAASNFSSLNLERGLLDTILKSNYVNPTIVQKYSIPIVLDRRDIMTCAQTGSGKTAAFLVPIINMLMQRFKDKNTHNSSSRNYGQVEPLALILVPTRELAIQTYDESCKFTSHCQLISCVVYGGESIYRQISYLNRGCDILVATPGRLKDLHDRGKISFRSVKYLVLDEADRMLDMGFEPQIRELVQNKDMPSTSHRQTLMFSATFQKKIQVLASEFLCDQIFLSVGKVGSASQTITQKVEWVKQADKASFLLDVLSIDPSSLKLVFVETKRRAHELEVFLNGHSIPAISIHGDKSQWEREEALYLFKKGSRPVLVATAVAARGLDIDDISIVINFDIPSDIDDYVHRIGRTGRAGSRGQAISFFNERNYKISADLYQVLKESHQKIPEFLNASVGKSSQCKEKSYVGFTRREDSQVPQARRNFDILTNGNFEHKSSKSLSNQIDWFDQN